MWASMERSSELSINGIELERSIPRDVAEVAVGREQPASAADRHRRDQGISGARSHAVRRAGVEDARRFLVIVELGEAKLEARELAGNVVVTRFRSDAG